MIDVGTKLKSTRSGEIVEVIKKESGSMKVRLADGTEKTLSDATVARWYDEVKDSTAAEPKKQSKKDATLAASARKKVVEEKVKTAKPKKENADYTMANQLAGSVKEHIEKANYSFLVKKEYTAIVGKGEKHLAHVWLQKSKVKFSFKGTDLVADDKKWMLELPKSHRRSYNYQVDVKDPTLLKRVIALLDKING